jgi:hypothetical protein
MAELEVCPDCDREVDARATVCPQCGCAFEITEGRKDSHFFLYAGMLIAVGIAVMAAVVLAPRESPAPVHFIEAGDEVTIGTPEMTRALLCVDPAAWDAMVAAESRLDREEFAVLIKRGQVVHVEKGTRAKVIETAINSVRVRIREGPNQNVEAWIQRELVVPVQ